MHWILLKVPRGALTWRLFVSTVLLHWVWHPICAGVHMAVLNRVPCGQDAVQLLHEHMVLWAVSFHRLWSMKWTHWVHRALILMWHCHPDCSWLHSRIWATMASYM